MNKNQIQTDFYIVFEIPQNNRRPVVKSMRKLVAKRMTKGKPKKLGKREFFAKFSVSVPSDYVDRPEPKVSLCLDDTNLADQALVVAERLRHG